MMYSSLNIEASGSTTEIKDDNSVGSTACLPVVNFNTPFPFHASA